MSHLVNLDQSAAQPPEGQDYNFGYYVFDQLPDIQATRLKESAPVHDKTMEESYT